MLRLFSRSPAPQLIEKCLLARCHGNVTVKLFGVPTKPAIFSLTCSSFRCKFDAFAAHLPLQAFSLTELLRLHPASATFCKAQTQVVKCVYIKGDKRRRGGNQTQTQMA